MSTFSGFSEEELKNIKSGLFHLDETGSSSAAKVNAVKVKKLDKIGYKPKKTANQYKLPVLQKHISDDAIDNIEFDKCKLSLRSPSTPSRDIDINNDNNKENTIGNEDNAESNIERNIETRNMINKMDIKSTERSNVDDISPVIERKQSIDVAPDIVRGVVNYSEDECANHTAKLQELQLRQRLMEEQNKRRKEMLAKALADRTKQTAEEVMRLEKIKKELQVLDSQFSQDVAVLRGKIDQACLTYADAEKHYLKVEKEFLQAKIHLQKEKEKKELLTEHLCALITHNETRKAQKLETLMLELATDTKSEVNDIKPEVDEVTTTVEDEKPEIVDGVDERTGKIVELTSQS